MTGLDVNIEGVDKLIGRFNLFSAKDAKATLRKALNIVATQLHKDTQAGVPIPYLAKGVVKQYRSKYNTYYVHVLGSKNIYDSWTLRFFENGTKDRKTKKGYNRGKIKAYHFLKNASEKNEPYFYSQLSQALKESIEKTFKKKYAK